MHECVIGFGNLFDKFKVETARDILYSINRW